MAVLVLWSSGAGLRVVGKPTLTNLSVPLSPGVLSGFAGGGKRFGSLPLINGH